MSNRDGYYYYEAGQAVAAAHLKLVIRHVSANPASRATEIELSRRHAKERMTLWLTGMAAERKCLGKSDPLRRTRNRLRVRSLIEAAMNDGEGSTSRRRARAKLMLNQAQDRANAICNHLLDAIRRIAAHLRDKGGLDGLDIEKIVAEAKSAIPAEEDGDPPPPKHRRRA